MVTTPVGEQIVAVTGDEIVAELMGYRKPNEPFISDARRVFDAEDVAHPDQESRYPRLVRFISLYMNLMLDGNCIGINGQ